MPNLQLIRRTIEQRIATEFVDVPVYFGNQQTSPPNNTHWLWCGVNIGDNSYQSLDGLDWVNGVAQVNVFAPVASGTGTALSLGQRIKNIFNRIKASGIYFRPANGPRTVAQQATSAWFQMAVSVAFVAEYNQAPPAMIAINYSLSNLQSVRRAIEQRIATEFVDVPVFFGNQQTSPPNNAHWLWCGVDFSDSSYQSMDGLDWVDGVARLNVFAPIASGTGTALDLAQRITGLFNRIRASGLYFRPANGPRVVSQQETSAWFQVAVSVDFVAEYYSFTGDEVGLSNLTLNLSLSSSYLGRAF